MKIIHFDFDAFYASVEQRDRPEYQNKPVIIGGRSNRGVVATCSYEARKFGIKSAMSIVLARKKCPQGIFIPPDMDKYTSVSKEIFKLLENRFDKIEKVSIDEGYIDVTSIDKSPIEIAQELKKIVYDSTGLTISVGISYNKFLAKLASDWKKPNGLFEIQHSDIPEILKPLPIRKIHGIGHKSCEKLNRIGLFKIEDLYQYPEQLIRDQLGDALGRVVMERIHGIDLREVIITSERKSYGKETTFSYDLVDRSEIFMHLENYLNESLDYLNKRSLSAKTIVLKFKYDDFEQFTKSHTLEHHTHQKSSYDNVLKMLFQSIELTKPVRLIGVTLSNLQKAENQQMSFFDETNPLK